MRDHELVFPGRSIWDRVWNPDFGSLTAIYMDVHDNLIILKLNRLSKSKALNTLFLSENRIKILLSSETQSKPVSSSTIIQISNLTLVINNAFCMFFSQFNQNKNSSRNSWTGIKIILIFFDFDLGQTRTFFRSIGTCNGTVHGFLV